MGTRLAGGKKLGSVSNPQHVCTSDGATGDGDKSCDGERSGVSCLKLQHQR